jgi:hypothetical protein
MAAADHLAERALSYWDEQARRQGITPTSPILVRWGVGPSDLAPANADLLNVEPTHHQSPRTEHRSPRSMTQGVITALYDELYTRLGNDVLVVLGPPGAGKSGALLLLSLEALRRRHDMAAESQAGVRVPVWITCGSWNPDTTTLASHVAEVLTRDYPGLTSIDHGGREAPAALIYHGQLAVFLDGLDEMPSSLRPTALDAIAVQAGQLPVVVTSRTDDYRAAVSSGRFRPAAVIELCPVDPQAAAAYLTDRQSAERIKAWQPVLDHIHSHRESAISEVLASPLGLALARDTYANADPANLLQPKLTTPRAVLANIIGAFLEHAYPERRNRDRAVRWLSWIATHMSAGSATGSDLPWWHLPRWTPKFQLGLIAGVGVALVVVAASLLTELPSQGIGYAIMYGSQNAGDWWPTWLVVSGLWSLSAGLIAGLVAGLIVAWSRSRTTSPQAFARRPPRPRDLPPMLMTALATGAITILTPALFLGLPVALLNLLGVPVQLGNTYQELFQLFTLLGVTLAAVAALLKLWRTPVGDLSAGTPSSTYRADRRAARTVALSFGVATGSAFLAIGGLNWAQFHKEEPFWASLFAGLFQALQIGATFGIVAWVAAGVTPQVRFLQLALRARGHGRVEFLPLLEDALARQVLRQAGTMYQFRHAALQDYFAKHTRE